MNLSALKLQNQQAIDLSNGLKKNESVRLLILDNNQIGPQGVKAIAEMLETNETIKEIRLGQQKIAAGTDAEQALMRAAQKNPALIKLAMMFRDVSSRNNVEAYLRRNKDADRKELLANSQQK